MIRTGRSIARNGNVSPEKVNASTDYPPPIDSDSRRLLNRTLIATPIA